MKTRFISFLLLLAMSCGAFAQSSYQPTEENLKGAPASGVRHSAV